jgi:uncharacterized protein (DUF1330 family)
MSAYLIAQVEVHDPVAYEAYRSRTGDIVAKHGGRFIVRGGALHPLEGEPAASRLVVIEFPTLTAARDFYDSPEYQAIIPLRTIASTASLLIAEGVDAC